MGKGDLRTRRGKTKRGTFGNTRNRKKLRTRSRNKGKTGAADKQGNG